MGKVRAPHILPVDGPDPVQTPNQPEGSLAMAVTNGRHTGVPNPGDERLRDPPQLRGFSPVALRQIFTRYSLLPDGDMDPPGQLGEGRVCHEAAVVTYHRRLLRHKRAGHLDVLQQHCDLEIEI